MELLALVWTNLGRNKVRTVLTMLSVFVALFLFCALHGLTDTLSDSVTVGSEQRMIVRNKLSLVFPLPQSQLAQLSALPGVTSVSWSNWFGGQDPVNPHDFFAQFAVDARTYLPMYANDIAITQASPAPPGATVPPGVDPRAAAFLAERTACMVGESLMQAHHWKLGQTIHLNGTIYPGSWPFTIRAVYRPRVRAANDETMYFHWDYLYENSGQRAQIGIWVLKLADPSQAAALARKIDALFENSANATHTETERAFQAGFVSMLGNIGFVVNLLGLAIAFAIFLVAAVTMMMAARERTGEFAVLKTLGFGESAIVLSVLCESAVITLVGGIPGAVVAKLLLDNPNFRIPNFGPLFVHWQTVSVGVLVAALMGAFSGLVPAVQASRLRIVDALRKVG